MVHGCVMQPTGTEQLHCRMGPVVAGNNLVGVSTGKNKCFHCVEQPGQLRWHPTHLTHALKIRALHHRPAVRYRGVDGAVLLAVPKGEAPFTSGRRHAPPANHRAVLRAGDLERVPLAINRGVVVVPELVDEKRTNLSFGHVGEQRQTVESGVGRRHVPAHGGPCGLNLAASGALLWSVPHEHPTPATADEHLLSAVIGEFHRDAAVAIELGLQCRRPHRFGHPNPVGQRPPARAA